MNFMLIQSYLSAFVVFSPFVATFDGPGTKISREPKTICFGAPSLYVLLFSSGEMWLCEDKAIRPLMRVSYSQIRGLYFQLSLWFISKPNALKGKGRWWSWNETRKVWKVVLVIACALIAIRRCSISKFLNFLSHKSRINYHQSFTRNSSERNSFIFRFIDT